jgi:soluble lytic murein transglycosylase
VSGDDLLRVFQSAANYNRGYAINAAAIKRSDGNLTTYHMVYPRAFNKYVEPYAQMWGLDPNLAYAIMRQESAFRPEAKSFANAYGLMQIIPPTGEEIAHTIGYEDFHASQLNQPHVNTLFGTEYLSQLMKELGQQPVYTIAAYNAGPLAVTRWIRKAQNQDMDVFVELIPYEETNNYVKKVLINYLTYRKLYS